ncbi:3-phosphoshikimate 1-carboxyvinyltransferase [Candidatus Termititenax persephonae]|uniref:3-phosphoshikimate 1-carboxyvinyltransferase n=1 Tax=Candidatus Termititenax persephonae TaxID=2218525 RepID=A0A388TI94_9BACT|nr:3-phosphoshikimate 1-carboxyvinyltransferase [Candidatus Termititenax persephonae]
MKIKFTKNGLRGTLTVPGDKSISHRAVILAALASGRTEIQGFLRGEDCLNTLKNFKMMGVEYKENKDKLIIQGKGLQGLKKPGKALDVGNSGTAFRLMAGVLAGQEFITKLTGDASIQRRPMKRVTDPLRKMGGRFSGDTAPLIIFPSKLKGAAYESPVASAQVKSALLLAGLYAKGVTSVTEPVLSRDHTERMLKNFGVKLRTENLTSGKYKAVLAGGVTKLQGGLKINIPGDFSSAAFFIVGALILPGSKLLLKNVGVNPTRIGLLEALKKMGAKITLKNKRLFSGEPVADIEVVSSALQGVEVGGELLVRMIDEVPIFAVAAALAKGRTVIKNAEELRVKESDRIKAVVEMLKAFGLKAAETSDGLLIDGNPQVLDKLARINTYHDHRIAMSAAILGLLNKKETSITDDKCIDTSFPNFAVLLKEAGK